MKLKKSALKQANENVSLSLLVNFVEALLLGIAAWITGSAGIRAQTADTVSELAVCVFLLLGVLAGNKKTDATHPLGYGRERFFWSLFAALGIFVGGGGVALDGAVRSATAHSQLVNYPIAYLALTLTLLLDLVSLYFSIKSLKFSAGERSQTFYAHLRRNSDPSLTTIVLSGACGVVGGLIAVLGLLLCQVFDKSWPDTASSAIIGLLLLLTSGFLLHVNRELLTGRGVSSSTIKEMRELISAQAGVENVPDLFGVVVGPSSLIVDGDVTFVDDLTVTQVEAAILSCSLALRKRWPSIEYVYLTPVSVERPRRVVRTL